MSASDENDNYLNEETSLLPANYTAQKQENNGSGHIDDDGAGQHLKISTTIILLLVASILGMPLLLATTTSNKAKVSNDLVDNSVVDTSASESAVSPHIVFILADDLGWNALGYNNYDLSFATPNIDSLAQGGLTLANYYAQEICTPSRASLLTGRYPLTVGMQTGVVAGYTPWGLNLNEETIAEVLSDAGYATHIIGKWHLGHHSPRYLPTARGFDTFVGYLDGDNYYYSKRNPFSDTFRDFLVADRDCYAPYVAGNLHNYSTHLYKDLAVEIIESHDQTTPLFLYLPFQAVHTPFVDLIDSKEISSMFVSDEIAALVESEVVGEKRKVLAYTLNVLDTAVGSIVAALERTGMMENTYLIFASDNGGCYESGGRNGPLRGTKGTLLEGGVKVDAFISSPLLSSAALGAQYSGLFHVSDWFPTMLEMAGVSYTARDGYALDGVSHLSAFADPTTSSTTSSVREYMLYNSYFNVQDKELDMWVNAPMAVRDGQYKLIHFYNSSSQAGWYQPGSVLDGDDDLDSVNYGCSVSISDSIERSEEFVYALYDLLNDPYETTNLYDNTDDDAIVTVKAALYAKLEGYHNQSTTCLINVIEPSEAAFTVWQQAGGVMVPYVTAEDVASGEVGSGKTATELLDPDKAYPSLCL